MEIEFIGAAQTVTGSKHLIRTKHATVLLDCGLYQGKRRESIEKNQSLGLDPKRVDAVVLSHAHIDHSGALPIMVRRGFRGPIYATSATRDLCAAMLMDAAMIQQSDARFINRQIERGKSDMEPVEPLYDERDVLGVLDAIVAMPYHRAIPIANGVFVSFLDAGHVLGSAITLLDVEEDGRTKRLVFTGDLGRRRMPILRDPEVADDATVLITESTYGDRLHKPIEQMDDELADVVGRVIGRGGRIVIPSFALERAQEIVYALKGLKEAGRLPKVRVYVDSPLTVKITDVFKLHPECLDEEALQILNARQSPFEFDELRYISSVEDSKALSESDEPAIIISASGMCEAGRVLHHLRVTVSDPKNAVLIVGYQAPHTLGRRLVEGRSDVRIFGVEVTRQAEVLVLNGFSAHADQKDLVEYASDVRDRGALEKVILVHGDPKPQQILGKLLGDRGIADVAAPGPGDRITI
ncbi:MAG: MBL fold metallo-hydrolase [Polyangiaceae bacterium]